MGLDYVSVELGSFFISQIYEWVWSSSGKILTGELKDLEKNLFCYHFVHHIDWPRCKPRPPLVIGTNRQSYDMASELGLIIHIFWIPCGILNSFDFICEFEALNWCSEIQYCILQGSFTFLLNAEMTTNLVPRW
jgi:hypothetical protein